MVTYAGKFRLVLLTPHGKLLECRAGSVILPGHDGQLGVLRNHAPMLVKLGMGLVRVEDIVGRPSAYFVVNGGFARVSENHVTVLAFDVTTFEGMEPKEAKEMLSRAKSLVYGGEYIKQMEEMDFRRAGLIVRMAEYARMSEQPSESE